MCGLAGFAHTRPLPAPLAHAVLSRMGHALRHRGPDGSGVEVDERFGLAHVRLSVLDEAGGAQPMTTDDGRHALVFNGEIFNHQELRRQLEQLGHRFRTRSDTEVLLRGWVAWGAALLPKLNGQFAFAVVDREARTVALVRDRFGILPLFHAEAGGALWFASEIKALFAGGGIRAELDPVGIDQAVTFWGVRPPRTAFVGVQAVEPGSWVQWEDGILTAHRWYALDLAEGDVEPPEAEEAVGALLRSAVDHRLLADVAVASYLSGGLDSSVVSALAAYSTPETLRTFSVAFEDRRFDESDVQRAVATTLSTAHTSRRVSDGELGRVFPEVVWHAEAPLLRTAPAPLFLLSRLVRERGIKVVLSGEGADEVFGGYDLFKDAEVRQFCLRHPESTRRPRLFDRLYPLDVPTARGGEFWRRSFLESGPAEDPLFSHLPRFRMTSWIKGAYAEGFRDTLAERGVDALEELRQELPSRFSGWSTLARASYLEMQTFLSPYLLAAQGDRMAMAHGVELRVPYLDHRLVEYAARLPGTSKLRGLRDKRILRRAARWLLPERFVARPKQPYRAPDLTPFFGPDAPEYVADLLTPAALREAGVFDPGAVAGLLRRRRAGAPLGVRESQALVAVLSTSLLHQLFVTQGAANPAPSPRPSLLHR